MANRTARTKALGSGHTSCWVEFRECVELSCAAVFAAHSRRNRRYCSISCSKRDMNRHLTPAQRAARDAQWSRDRLSVEPRACKICDALYVPVSSRQRWCSTCIPTKEARGRYTRTGMSHPAWLEALARYGGLCWVCQVAPATDADHCHATNKPRGALCGPCNMKLAHVEDVLWLTQAQKYLEEIAV